MGFFYENESDIHKGDADLFQKLEDENMFKPKAVDNYEIKHGHLCFNTMGGKFTFRKYPPALCSLCGTSAIQSPITIAYQDSDLLRIKEFCEMYGRKV